MAKEFGEGEIEGKVSTLKADKKLRFDLHTAVAWIIWAGLLTYAYLHPNPQFPSYAVWLTAGTLGYSGKRLLQKRKEFNGAGGFFMTEAK